MSKPVGANVYPQDGPNPTTANANHQRSNVGVCFSGGGSRALTCAWGQMIGLRQLTNADGTSALDNVRYLSSVSGGTWASALYTYLPDDIAEDQFFVPYFPPEQLFLDTSQSGGMNVREMETNALGTVPQKFANLFEMNLFENIIADFITIVLAKDLELSDALKWLWMYIVGNDVLAPFGLYTYDFSLFGKGLPWDYDGAKYISLTPSYAQQHIFNKPNHPAPSDFQFVRTDGQGNASRPLLIMNTNIVATDVGNGVRRNFMVSVPLCPSLARQASVICIQLCASS